MGSNLARGRLLLAAVAVMAGCGDDDGKTLAQGERELVRGAQAWPEALREELRLEHVNVDGWVHGKCRRPATSRADWIAVNVNARQVRLVERAAARLGERRAGMWSDGCDRGRLKIGIARGPEALVRSEVAALRRLMRATGVRGADLVAVPSTTEALKRAQRELTRGSRDDVVVTGPNPALNAIDVGATFDRGEDWEQLRATAREHGVTAVLERDDGLDDLR